jgi:nucleotide-binding universal stress UspA family protein
MITLPLQVRNILIPTDFSDCADHALSQAADLATRFGAVLHILHVVDKLDPDWYGVQEAQRNAPELREQIRKAAEERLRAREDEEHTQDVETRISLQLSFSVTNTVEEYVEERSIDLVVMGTHGRRAVEHFTTGSVAERTVRRVRCPVITVTEQAPWESEDRGISDILVPIDFSTPSKAALRIAKQFAELYKSRVHLLFVAEKRTVPTFSDTGVPGVSFVEMDEEIVANADKALEQLNASVGNPDIPATFGVEQGHVAENILDYTEERGIEMIVMATRGLTGLSHFILGSTTERVVRVASCPVLTFHADRVGESADDEPAEVEA